MGVAQHALIGLPCKNVGEIRDAETLASAVDGRERLLSDDGAIFGARWAQAVIAVAARRRVQFAEIGEKSLAPAPRHFCKTDECVELLPLDLLERIGSFRLRDPLPKLHDVL